MDLASMTNIARDRLLTRLDGLRDMGMSLNNLCLVAARAVRMGDEEDAILLADIIGRVAEMNRIAQNIARELQS